MSLALNLPSDFTLRTYFVPKTLLFLGTSDIGVSTATSLLLMHSSSNSSIAFFHSLECSGFIASVYICYWYLGFAARYMEHNRL